MNNTSSRSHAIFTIKFTQVVKKITRIYTKTSPTRTKFIIDFVVIVSNIFQARFMGDMPSETISKIHLVDLAGRFVSLHISILFLQV